MSKHLEQVAAYADMCRGWKDKYDEAQAALARSREGSRALGRIIKDNCAMVLDITGLHAMVDEDGDADWGAIWETAMELPGRIDQLSRERDELAAKVARVEALVPDSNGERREHVDDCEGEDTCPACWAEDVAKALAGDA